MNRLIIILVLVTAFCIPTEGSEPSIWSVNSHADVLGGDARGVSIDDSGTISPAPALTQLFRTEQPYIWSSAVDNSGNIYLGTGADGKIFKVDAGGKGVLFADLAELNVSSLAAGTGGEIFAATSPDGKVYRIDAAGKAEIFFDPKEKYIWSILLMPDGSLAVATGENGKIFRVRTANATPEASLLADTSQTHVISLAADKAGNLYAGTDSEGLVLRFGADGKPFALLDSPLREIHSLAVAGDGSVYALAIGESAATTKSTDAGAASAAAEKKTVSTAKPASTIEAPQKSRYDLTGAKSAVFRILPDGGSDVVWASSSINGFSIAPDRTSGVLIGTSDKGRIYSVTNDGRETLLVQTDANQVSTLLSTTKGLFATSSNQGSLFRIGPGGTGEGTYESAVLDAKASAEWGRIWWRSSGGVQIQTRSGNTAKPDETWSGWSEPYANSAGSQVTSPKAKYLQWRAVLRSTPVPGALSEVNVSFLPRNIAPEILSVQVLPTNVGLAPNPPIQIDPNIELSGLDPQVFGVPNAAVAPRRIYQRGARSQQWTSEDRNGDKLVYDVFYKEVGDAAFKPLKKDISETFYTLDGQTLADGRYIFRIVAHDTPSNPPGLSLAGDRTSEPVDIDNTPPEVAAVGAPQISGDSARVVFAAADKASYITRAEFSVNGGEWLPVYSDDGISDGPNERYTLTVPVRTAGELTITIRVFDVNGNSGNGRVVVRK
jgi:sugar lactone lactonase YvrE